MLLLNLSIPLVSTCLALLRRSMLVAVASAGFMQQVSAQILTGSANDATETVASEAWNLHGQLTNVTQGHGSFPSAFSGPNSLTATAQSKETTDATLFWGLHLWRGGELYLNPEIDQGFGLDDTVGAAGFVSGAAYKVGSHKPYARMQRAFVRQTFALDGGQTPQDSGANALAGPVPDNNVIVTLGKFSAVDVFDNNRYAHDPRADFLNWAVIDGGAFDYAADSWGYTVGASAEWTQGAWTSRLGYFALSKDPNGENLDLTFAQHSWIVELERRYQLVGHPGTVRLLAFTNHANLASYSDATAALQTQGAGYDWTVLRKPSNKQGLMLNLEQELAKDVGAFARISWNDGKTEAEEFTDINRSVSAGLSIKGSYWGQPDHKLGLAVVSNALSAQARAFFAAGGTGILIGDGQLPSYGAEQILEANYNARINKYLSLSGDYQYLRNPAYNPLRGPVSVFALRAHLDF